MSNHERNSEDIPIGSTAYYEAVCESREETYLEGD